MLKRTVPFLLAAVVATSALFAVTGAQARSGADDGPTHDVKNEHGGRGRGMDNFVKPAASDDKGGATTTAATSRRARSIVLAALAGTADFPGAKGKAKFVSSGSGFQLEIEVEHIARLAGTRVDFFMNGRIVGTQTVGALGEAKVRVSGPGTIAVAGKRVEVKTQAGIVIAAGIFP